MPQLVTNWPTEVTIPSCNGTFPSAVTEQLAGAPSLERDTPLWHGPQAGGALGGVTQSMLQGYLGCRERFRVKYVLGLKPMDRWDKASGYGNLWHCAEEHHAKNADWIEPLKRYACEQLDKYPMQRSDIEHWFNVCMVQFPEYIKHWASHPDVQDRTPLMQERVFDVGHRLPTGRVVRLRGKFDSVDLIPSQGGIYLCENKTKGDVDPVKLQRQLRFDLQVGLYLIALREVQHDICSDNAGDAEGEFSNNICGVRYNVVLREVTIRPHAEKVKRGKRGRKTIPDEPDTVTPAETSEEFYERLRRDYYAADPDKYFFRLTCRVSDEDVRVFRRQCLDPVLENLADDYEWWAWCLKKGADQWDSLLRADVFPAHAQRHFRFPFGCYNALTESGFTDYDQFLESGIMSGLRKATTLFDELQEPTGTAT